MRGYARITVAPWLRPLLSLLTSLLPAPCSLLPPTTRTAPSEINRPGNLRPLLLHWEGRAGSAQTDAEVKGWRVGGVETWEVGAVRSTLHHQHDLQPL